MGAGKTSVGRKLANYLKIDFFDADEEVKKAAGCSIQNIFEIYGEAKFRKLEEKVICRLLTQGSRVIATGGGAYLNPRIRNEITEQGFSIWLKASLDILVQRTNGRSGRPLLKNKNSREILDHLIKKRHPIYSKADLTIETSNESVCQTLNAIIDELRNRSFPSVGDP